MCIYLFTLSNQRVREQILGKFSLDLEYFSNYLNEDLRNCVIGRIKKISTSFFLR